jgi:hypothetical protein
MCFRVDPNYPDVLTATEDIQCFKELYSDLSSLYKHFRYKLGETYELGESLKPDQLPNTDFWSIDRGFHSYCSDMTGREWMATDSVYIWAEFCIPQGSKYYVNHERNEYVSNSIKFGSYTKMELV